MKTETPKQHATTRHKSEIPVHPVNPVQKPTASAPKRRIRRRACTKAEISNHKSEIPVPNPVHPVNPVQKKSSSVRAKPFETLPEFAHLRPDQLDYIHDLLRDST